MSHSLFLKKLPVYLKPYFEYCIWINGVLPDYYFTRLTLKILPVLLLVWFTVHYLRKIMRVYLNWRYDKQGIQEEYGQKNKEISFKRRFRSLHILNVKKDKTENEWKDKLKHLNEMLKTNYTGVKRKRNRIILYYEKYLIISLKNAIKMRKKWEVIWGGTKTEVLKSNMRTESYFGQTTGAGGSGKSVVGFSMIAQLANDVDRIVIINVKPDHLFLKDHPKVVIYNPLKPEDQQEIIKFMKGIFEMGRELTREVEKTGKGIYDLIEFRERYPDSPIIDKLKTGLIIAEEAPQWLRRDKNTSKALIKIQDLFKAHLELNRYLNNFVMVISQTAQNDTIILDNTLFTTRISSNMTSAMSLIVHGDSKISTGADLTKGRFAITTEKYTDKVQMCYADEKQIKPMIMPSEPSAGHKASHPDSLAEKPQEPKDFSPRMTYKMAVYDKKTELDGATRLNKNENNSSPLKEKANDDFCKITATDNNGAVFEIRIRKNLSQKKILSVINNAFRKREG